jgi:hypothetical protein
VDQLFENWRKFINEENAKSSGVLSNVFKLCPAGTQNVVNKLRKKAGV